MPKKNTPVGRFFILFACLLGNLALLVGCGDKNRIDRVMEGDTEIVLNHVEPYRIKGQPSTFTLEKVFSIDTERDDLAAAGMGSAGIWDADDEGNVYVVGFKNEKNFIFRFDSAGRLKGSFGRRGQGPGELQWPFVIVVTNEVFLADNFQKLVVYDLSGALLRETRLKRSALQVEALKNGRFLAFYNEPGNISGNSYSMPLALFDSAWSEIKILDRFGGNLEYQSQVPFFMWRVSGDRIIIANQARGYEIWVYDFDGNLVRKIRKEYRPVAPTEEIKKAILGPDYRQPGINQDKYFSNPLPPLNQFFSDDEGRLFVMTYEPGPNPGEYIWDIFNPDGVFVGRKALDIIWAGLYLGPQLTFVKNGRLYCQKEKESGFRELFVYKMIWK